MRSPIAALALLAGLTALGTACSSTLTDPSAIIGGVWKLRSIEDAAGSLTGIPNPTGYTLTFQDAGRLGVRADCNVCTGAYTASGAQLQIGSLSCTRVACSSSSHEKEFLAVLGAAETFSVLGIELSIEGSKGTLRMNR
jgi:heat shock protein HslJ